MRKLMLVMAILGGVTVLLGVAATSASYAELVSGLFVLGISGAILVSSLIYKERTYRRSIAIEAKSPFSGRAGRC